MKVETAAAAAQQTANHRRQTITSTGEAFALGIRSLRPALGSKHTSPCLPASTGSSDNTPLSRQRYSKVAEPHVVSELVRKRAELAGEVQAVEKRAAQLRADLIHVDAVLRMFHSTAEPDEYHSQAALQAPPAI